MQLSSRITLDFMSMLGNNCRVTATGKK